MPTRKKKRSTRSTTASRTKRSSKTTPRTTRTKSRSKAPVRKAAKQTKKSAPRKVAARKAPKDASRLDLIEVRNSKIHGSGVYARQDIRKGKRILEYVGERISHAEADRRYALKGDDDGHTFLFIVDGKTVIDGGNGGNPSRYVNHSCDPNCETVIEDRRVFVETIRDIKAGEELGYDYQLTWESTDDPADLALYACRCGAPNCRGTMLDPVPLDKQKQNRKKRG